MSDAFVFLFGGQGSQTPGMGSDFADRYPAIRQLYNDFMSRYPLYDRLLDPSFDRLNDTLYAQPALTLLGLAVTHLLREDGIQPVATAGLSIGEFPALVAAGIYSPSAVLDIVAKRAALMDARLKQRRADGFDDGMLAVVGLQKSDIETLLIPYGTSVSMTNLNAPTQIVIGGLRTTLEKVKDTMIEAGARRAIMLECEGAFHSSVFDDDVERLKSTLLTFEASEPSIPMPFNALGGFPSADNIPPNILSRGATERFAHLMSHQMNATVQLDGCLNALLEAGYTHFIEIAPRAVLTPLLRKKSSSITAHTISDLDSYEAFRTTIFEDK